MSQAPSQISRARATGTANVLRFGPEDRATDVAQLKSGLNVLAVLSSCVPVGYPTLAPQPPQGARAAVIALPPRLAWEDARTDKGRGRSAGHLQALYT